MSCIWFKPANAIDDYTANKRVNEFMSKIDPLDLIVFRGGDEVSSVIREMQKYKTGNGDISHVEIAITPRYCHNIHDIVTMPEDTLFSWGSTLSGPLNDGVYNAETGHSTFGVQVRVMRDLLVKYLRNHNANVGICKLLNNPIDLSDAPGKNDDIKAKLSSAYELYHGVMYDANPISLLAAIFPDMRIFRRWTSRILGFTDVNNWLFCSEFVTLIYEHIGLLGPRVDARNVLPVDFLRHDGDVDGITTPICHSPLWLKGAMAAAPKGANGKSHTAKQDRRSHTAKQDRRSHTAKQDKRSHTAKQDKQSHTAKQDRRSHKNSNENNCDEKIS